MRGSFAGLSKIEWGAHGLVWAGIALLLSRVHYDGDIWWHIAVGREIAQSGALPGGDEWSFTAPGISYVHHSWLSGLLFYWLWTYAGEAGLNVFHFSIQLTTCILVYIVAQGKMERKHALVLACLLAYWTSTQTIRPHIFTPLFTVALLGLLGDLNQLDSKRFVGVLALFLAWANLHGGFSVGLIVVGALAAGCGVAHAFFNLLEKPAKCLFALMLGCFAVTLINPYGFGIYSAIAFGVHHQSFDWLNITLTPLNVTIPTAIAILLSALFLAWYVTYIVNNRRWSELPWLFLGLAIYATLLTARRLDWMLFIPMLLLFRNYAIVKGDLVSLGPNFLRPYMLERGVWVRTAIVYVMILAIFIPHVHARANNPVRDWYEGFPREFEEYFLDQSITGNVFCPLTWSGRITLVTEGRIKIYIDGRLQLYPSDFFYDYLDILHRRGLTASQIKAYDITYLFMPMEFVDNFRVAAAPIQWKPIKVSGNAVLLKREDQPNRFARFGKNP